MNKLDGQSMDLVKENVEKLKELFPSIVKEDKIDFDELELLLGENINRNNEQYSFTWNGKTEATKLAQKRSTGTLRPCKEESKDWDTTQNLYIEGDNLEVLRLLQASYNGRIKMIYIDPPYNTGHDFVYKDNFEDNIKNYKEQTGQAAKSNADTDGRYHTNWLNMMYPRLKLARNLLTDDGVIFISIDDNEQANLKKICDEVFGENNFVNIVVWQANPGGGKGDGIETTKQYFYVYARNKINFKDLGTQKLQNIQDYPLQDEFSYYKKGGQLEKWGNADTIYTHPNLGYSIYYNPTTNDIKIKYDYNRDELQKNRNLKLKYDNPDILLVNKGYVCIRPRITNAGQPGRWRVEEKTFLERLSHKDFIFEQQDESFKIYEKDRFENYKFVKMKDTISEIRQTNDTTNLFNGKKVFSYPKPVKFMEYVIKNFNDSNLTVLDFFSGSATTAHAVMQLNANDGGNRKFILVQFPEDLDENFKNTSEKDIVKNAINLCEEINAPHKLTEVAKERIRRAGKKIENLDGLDGAIIAHRLTGKDKLTEKDVEEFKKSETYQQYLKDLDTGFKVFKLDSSNLKKWDNTPTKDIDTIKERIQTSMDYLKDDRNELDLVYEVMLKYGIDLSYPVRKTGNEKAYIVEAPEYKLLVCTMPNISLDDVESFANENVGTYLFADRCFGSDSLLINTEEILKSRNKEMRLF